MRTPIAGTLLAAFAALTTAQQDTQPRPSTAPPNIVFVLADDLGYAQVTRAPNAPIELYDLERDESEKNNVAGANADVVRRIDALMRSSRTPAVLPKWNFQPAAAADK